MSAREVAEMDPQQRLTLEVAHEALFDANINPQALNDRRVGVFVGAGMAEYLAMGFADPNTMTPHTMSGVSLGMIANRLSYLLNLEGPSLTVDTACSSSLTALYIACQALNSGDCDLALVAGVNALLGPSPFVGLSQAHMLSPRGTSLPFDADADGFVRGEGCGVIVLGRSDHPFQDLRRVYAEIIGCEANEDGKTASLTIPSAARQTSLMRHALKRARIAPEQVVYVEAHGTGTPVGDPIEASSISEVMVGNRRAALPIGSAKGHTGHLETGAGIVGLVKAALCLHHRQLVPTAGHNRLTPKIDAEALRLRVTTEVESLPLTETGDDPVIGVSSYGFGGANAFALLKPTSHQPEAGGQQPAVARVLAISSHRPESLADLEAALTRIPSQDRPDAVAWAGIALPALRHRRVRLAADGDVFGPRSVVRDGEVKGETPRLIFAYGGQGSQHPSMGKPLYEQFPAFRQAVDEADRLYTQNAGYSVVENYGFCRREMDESELLEVLVALPCIIMMQVGLTALLKASGVVPAAVMGHSTGEMTGAWACGAINLDTLMFLTHERASAQDKMQAGAMAAWSADEEQTATMLQRFGADDQVVIAARNGEEAFTLSGDVQAIEAIVAYGQQQGIRTIKLDVPRAYHSPHVDAVLESLKDRLDVVETKASTIPFISSVTHLTGLTAGEDLTASYWVHNIRNAVDFHAGAGIAASHGDLFVEISPRAVLSGYLVANHDLGVLATQDRKMPGDLALLQCLAELFVRGVDVDWATVQSPARFVSIPRIPWNHDTPIRSVSWKAPTQAQPAAEISNGPITLSSANHAYLADHKVEGEIVMPGAGLVALALRQMPKGMHSIEFRRFLPLWTANGETSLEWKLEGEQWQWVVDDISRFSCVPSSSSVAPKQLPLDAVRARCPATIDVTRLYDSLRQHSGLDFGPSFRTLVELHTGDTEAIARIKVSDQIPHGWGRTAALLDGSFQALAALRGLDVHCYVPLSISQLDWSVEAHQNTLWCHATLTDIGKDWAQGDISILDSNETLVGRIKGLRLQRVKSSRAARPDGFTVIHEPLGLPEAVRQWDWTDPAACLKQLYEYPIGKQTLRILDLSTELISLPALSAIAPATLSKYSLYMVAAAAVPPNAPSWCHASDCDAVPEALGFDIVIGHNGHCWVAPGGVLVPWQDVIALPEPHTQLNDAPLKAHLLGSGLEAWPAQDATAELDLATVVIDARESLEDASALLKRAITMAPPPALVFLVREDVSAPPSPIWGFVRAARNEQPQLNIYAAGVPAAMNDAGVQALRVLCQAGLSADAELRWDGSEWKVRRLVPISAPPLPEVSSALRLEVTQPGQLASLRWRAVNSLNEGLDPDEIRVQVHVAPLNFKDVMLALGMLPGYAPILGMECCGTIVDIGADVPRLYPELQPGRKILALALTAQEGEPRRALFGSTAVVRAKNAILKPDNVQDIDGAGFLGVYTTAWYGLHHIAQLKAGETVLIHSAAGGVGQAAVQVARTLGAEIIATAGTAAKRKYLSEVLGLDKVFDSRHPQDFQRHVQALTNGRGVDVVLNSLAGDGLRESLHCLAPGGRHIEIGKRDILENSALGLLALKNNISFHSVHIDGLVETHPERIRALVEECTIRLASGNATALPSTVFPASRAVEAFRLMASGDHVGKVVITMPDGSETDQEEKLAIEAIAQAIFSVDDVLLVTGGMGGIGLALTRFLAERGAGRILLGGRRTTETGRAAVVLEGIRRDHPRCRIDIVPLDLREDDQLVALFSREPGITGVFHLATAFKAEPASAIDRESLETWTVKAGAAWRLHQLTAHKALRHFVLFSSLGGLHGNPHQAVYVAANAALHEVARHRRTQGLPAIAIDLPIMLGAGRLSQAEHLLELQINTGRGFAAISYTDLEGWLERLFVNPQSSAPVIALDAPLWRGYWSLSPTQRSFFSHLVPAGAQNEQADSLELSHIQDPQAVEEAICAAVAALLGAQSEEIEPETPLANLGLDSLAAVELLVWVRKTYGVEVSQSKLLTGASVSTLVDLIVGDIKQKQVTAPTVDCSEIERIVQSQIASLLGAQPDEIELDAPLMDFGLDSLAAVELLVWARQNYGVEISQSSLLTGATTESLVQAIAAKATARQRTAAPITPPVVPASPTPERSGHEPIEGHKPSSAQMASDAPASIDKTALSIVVAPTADPAPCLVSIPLSAHDPVLSGAHTLYLPSSLTLESVQQLSKTLSANRQPLVIRAQPNSVHFCLGMDLAQATFGDSLMSQGLEHFAKLAKQLETASMPIICVVEGDCRGGGMLFPSLASIVLATPAASFGFPEVRRGGLPGIVSVAAQRRLSPSVCRRLMLTGDPLDADAASQYGMVDFVGSKDEVEKELKRLLGRFATIEPDLLQRCQTQCPASDMDSALVMMGGLGQTSPEASDTSEPLVRLLHDSTDGLAVLELNDPLHNNAIDKPLAEELRQAVRALKQLEDVRAVIFQGAGPHFCVGVNPYRLMAQVRQMPVLSAAHLTFEIYSAFVSIRELEVPVIAVVHGKIVGGGLAAMLNADYRICTDDATFNLGNLSRGVCPGMLLSESLERLVGHRWANELYLNDYTLTARQALEMGLVNEMHASLDQAKASAHAMAQRIAKHPAMGVRATLSLMRPPLDLARLARESLGIARCNVQGQAFTGAWQGDIRRPPAPAMVIPLSASSPSQGPIGDSVTATATVVNDLEQAARAKSVGIQAMELYFPNHMALQADMERHNDCEGKYTVGLGQEAVTFCGDNEDAVSMSLTAVQRLMERYGIDWSQIGRLEVGTESQVDRSKSIKSYLMQLFEDHGNCNIEGVDTYNACYGGTSALFNTVAWCQSEAWDGRLGLVVCVDIADLNADQSYLNGAAAVAMLVGPNAALVMKPERATHMLHRWDFYKPVGWQDPFPLMRDGKHSIDVYTACLDGCQKLLTQRMGTDGLLRQHDHFVFHCTSTYLVKRAFDRIIENEEPRLTLREKRTLFETMVQPSTLLTRQIGSTYTASVYVNLYSLLLNQYEDIVGKTVGIYSYGSGASASLYRLEVVKPPQIDRDINQALQSRRCYDPAAFVQLTQEYSNAYGRFDYVPVERNDKVPGVFYLSEVDEWGRRTYVQEQPAVELTADRKGAAHG
ncbi:type I polyketide synthase [Pseudomonas sp. Q1]|uniref:type I polyketide synthase n=1 Tax=Pseudomonas sp. Q1 TaxID=2202823 RepID=UPI0021152D5A|nr:type I polyketide synthase [Pseudomonas sp. Q1]